MSNYYPGLAKLAISERFVQNVVDHVSTVRHTPFYKNATAPAHPHANAPYVLGPVPPNQPHVMGHPPGHPPGHDASHQNQSHSAAPDQAAQPGAGWNWMDKAYGAGAAGLAALAAIGHLRDHPQFHQFVHAYREMMGHPGAHAAPAAAPHPAPAAAPAGQSMFANTHPAALVAGGLGIGALGLGAGSLLFGGRGHRPRYPQPGYPPPGYPPPGYPQEGYPQQPYPPQYRYGR